MSDSTQRSILPLVILVIAGESIFLLPFVLARVFRPSLLEVYNISNFELGAAFSAYGIIALLSYFPGGILADRYAPRKLMSLSLIATALGGWIMWTIPSTGIFRAVYAFWGLSTIFLFWAAMIRATRHWGGQDSQGRAFGWLDGGRGLVSAFLSTILVVVFATLLPVAADDAELAMKRAAYRWILAIVCIWLLLVAALVYRLLYSEGPTDPHRSSPFIGLRRVWKDPSLWLQGIIIVCAYSAYKGTDDFSLLAHDVLGYDDVEAASVGTVALWLRPIAAISAGYLADRWSATRCTMCSFLIIVFCATAIYLGVIPSGGVLLFFILIVPAALGIYALRGLYFAIMKEGNIPTLYTGTAVGIVSAIGYTPDIFMSPLMGWLLDQSPGAEGHQHVFGVIALFSFIGLLATVAYRRVART